MAKKSKPIGQLALEERVVSVMKKTSGDVKLTSSILNVPMEEVFKIYVTRREERKSLAVTGSVGVVDADDMNTLVEQGAATGYVSRPVFEDGVCVGEELVPVSEKARLGFLDMYFKLTGKYAPEKKDMRVDANVRAVKTVDLQDRIKLISASVEYDPLA